MRRIGTRLLGVGLAAGLAVTTLGLWATGRLALYVNPESDGFIVAMAVVLLVGAVLSFALPLGAEADHGHDHGHDHDHDPVVERGSAATETKRGEPISETDHVSSRFARSTTGGSATGRSTTGGSATGGALALATVGAMLILPPASLSAELAMSRDTGAAPLFAGSDVVQLASVGDTADFGVGDWASAFASTTDPAAFDGDQVTLTGFATPAASGFDLTRLVITHCVIDAQPASIPVTVDGSAPDTGQWVTITGTVRSSTGGALSIVPTSVDAIAEPADPYEY